MQIYVLPPQSTAGGYVALHCIKKLLEKYATVRAGKALNTPKQGIKGPIEANPIGQVAPLATGNQRRCQKIL